MGKDEGGCCEETGEYLCYGQPHVDHVVDIHMDCFYSYAYGSLVVLCFFILSRLVPSFDTAVHS